MARVFLTGALRAAAGGEGELEIEADDVRSLRRELGRLHPELASMLAEDMAVAIDGEIHSDATFEKLEAESEVHFLPPLKGG